MAFGIATLEEVDVGDDDPPKNDFISGGNDDDDFSPAGEEFWYHSP
jgi:hypothetical protein